MEFQSYLVAALLLCLELSSVFAQSNCSTERSALLKALYSTAGNSNEMDRVFYPERQLPSRFITVNYDFLNDDGFKDNCTVTYYWASGGFLFVQPPKIFVFTSLLFSYPANDLIYLNLTLPSECRDLVSVNENGTCSCKSPILDRLTQQVP